MGEKHRPLSILALNWRDLRHPQAGGSEMNLFRQAREWVALGHHATLWTADYSGADEPSLRAEVIHGVSIVPTVETMDGVRIMRAGGRFSVYLRVAIYLLLRSGQYDCVLDVANGIPFFAPLFTRKPVALLVHHVHGRQWFTEFPWPAAVVGWLLERYLVPLVYRRGPVITVSPTTRDALIAQGFTPEHIEVIYNGVDTPFPPRGHVSRNPHAIVYAGRLKKYKRIGHLVRAVADLVSEFPDIRLDIIGDGDARDDLEELIAALGLEDRVQLHGYLDEEEKVEIMAGASVFAQPSMHEGWGLTVIEANALGLPCVAYDVPGLRAAICDGQTGLLATTDEEFRDALARLLGDAGLWDRMSRGAREWARRFSWERSAEETLKVLREGRVKRPASVDPAEPLSVRELVESGA